MKLLNNALKEKLMKLERETRREQFLENSLIKRVGIITDTLERRVLLVLSLGERILLQQTGGEKL